MKFTLLIVNFHYIRESKPTSGIYPLTPGEFEKQLDILARQYKFVSQSEIVHWLESRNYPDGNYCLITFDDGLAEQMLAFDMLERKGIPAVFYVPINPLKNGTALSVHQLHYIRSVFDEAELFDLLATRTSLKDRFIDPEKVRNQYRYDDEQSGKIKYFLNFILEEPEKTKVISGLFRTVVTDEAKFASHLYMTPSDIKKLAIRGMLGSHGTVHQPLAMMSSEDAQKDIVDSLKYLKAVTGTEIQSFSYPFGGDTAVSLSLEPLFSETSVRFSLTMNRGVNTLNEMKNQYFLKRVDTNDAPGGKTPQQLPA